MEPRETFIKRYFKNLPVIAVVLLVVFIATLFVFTMIAHEVLGEKEEGVDNTIFNYLSAHIINGERTRFMTGVTYFASAFFLQITYGALLLLYLLLKKWKLAVEIAAIGIGGFVVNYFMKLFFHRIRPPHPLIAPLKSFSFPSGHATSGFIFYGLVTYLIWKTKIPKPYKYITGFVLIAFSILIGFSRIYLRLHYPSDVAAGFCIGFSWLILCIWLFGLFGREPGNKLKLS